MEPRDRSVLEKVVEEVSYLESPLDGVSEDEFLADETMERAAAMTAINIGELAKHLSEGFFAESPGNELRYAAKTRYVYVHGHIYALVLDGLQDGGRGLPARQGVDPRQARTRGLAGLDRRAQPSHSPLPE